MRPMTILAVATAMLFALAPSTTAQTPPDEPLPPIEEYIPTFTRADLFLHRNTGAIGNLDAREGRWLKWDATRPTEATPALYIGNNYKGLTDGNHGPENFLTMSGVAAGDLDKIAFELFFNGPGQASIGCPVSLSLQLIVDDVEILSQDYTGSDGFNHTQVDDTTYKTRFVLTHFWEATKLYELEYGPDVTHDIYLNIQNFYACNEFVWHYDSADRPAGLIVNLTSPNSSYFKFNILDAPAPTPAAASMSQQLA